MSVPRITYVPHPDATREGELNALAAVYKFIIHCRANQNAAGVTSTSGDAKGSTRDRTKSIIQERR